MRAYTAPGNAQKRSLSITLGEHIFDHRFQDLCLILWQSFIENVLYRIFIKVGVNAEKPPPPPNIYRDTRDLLVRIP